jgi:hypothetical protein
MTVPSLVLVAGVPRSGSTWLYNAARLILASSGRVRAGWIDDIDLGCASDIPTLAKIHEFDSATAGAADIVLTSRRDLEQIAASALRFAWAKTHDELIEFLEGVVAKHEAWGAVSDLEVTYEQLTRDPGATVKRIARTLSVPIQSDQADDVAQTLTRLRFDGPPGTYDPVTLLHPKHVGETRPELPAKTRQEIRRRFADWLARFGPNAPDPPVPIEDDA